MVGFNAKQIVMRQCISATMQRPAKSAVYAATLTFSIRSNFEGTTSEIFRVKPKILCASGCSLVKKYGRGNIFFNFYFMTFCAILGLYSSA